MSDLLDGDEAVGDVADGVVTRDREGKVSPMGLYDVPADIKEQIKGYADYLESFGNDGRHYVEAKEQYHRLERRLFVTVKLLLNGPPFVDVRSIQP